MFVLFKQKTAYEMRIRDWSSDVCSSDLGFEPSPVCLLRPLAETMDVLVDVFAAVEGLGRRHWDDLHDAVVATTADLRTVDQWEIGGASCRERECQYV